MTDINEFGQHADFGMPVSASAAMSSSRALLMTGGVEPARRSWTAGGIAPVTVQGYPTGTAVVADFSGFHAWSPPS